MAEDHPVASSRLARAAPAPAANPGPLPARAPLKLWELLPLDANEPPFHFLDVVKRVLVAASTSDNARQIAAMHAGPPHGEVWRDEAITSCGELIPVAPGVIAAL